MTLDKDQKLLITGAVIVLVVAWIAKEKAVEVAKAAGEAVNPVNDQNIFNRGFNSLYQSITGSTGTLGTDLADWVHSGRDMTYLDQ